MWQALSGYALEVVVALKLQFAKSAAGDSMQVVGGQEKCTKAQLDSSCASFCGNLWL